MDNIVFLILRRMRQPLLTLIVVYTVAVFVLTLIPGRDDAGQVHYLSIFHAFYFVSFMSTTIGFGEIPYAFTDAQRAWVTLCLYTSVVAWIYALGTILSLLQDQTFQRALEERGFARRVRRMREPFYLICGYGETGQALVRALTDRGQHVVVIDKDEQRTSLIQLQNLRDQVPSLSADARKPLHLTEAGLPHPSCAGVVAVTDDNETNLKVALTSKLLHPDIKVICRADSHDVEANLASFGTDYIIDPFDTFSTHLATAFQTPCLYLLQRWFGGEQDSALDEPVYPPREGHWVVCGYGRFGKAMTSRLKSEGLQVTVIEHNPQATGEPPAGYVLGVGTEAETLLQAGADRAVGLVAGTDDDTNNLSIVMTARDINPDLFVVLRQNQSENRAIIDAVGADMVMHPSAIIAERIRVLLATPMLYQFSSLALHQDDAWACELVSRISAVVQQAVPDVREILIDDRNGGALCQFGSGGGTTRLGEVLRDPWQPQRNLPCIVLLISRKRDFLLLPDVETVLQRGDRLLVCGDGSSFTRLQWTLCHSAALRHVRGDPYQPQSWLWRKVVALLRRR
jgi:voltage-gated potassium channel